MNLSNCDITNKDLIKVKGKINTLIRKCGLNKGYTSEKGATFKSLVRSYIWELKQHYGPGQEIVDMICDTCKGLSTIEDLKTFVSLENITNIMLGLLEIGQLIDTVSSSHLIDSNQVQNRKLQNKRFLTDIYKKATTALTYVTNITDRNLVDAFFINRGTIGTRLGGITSISHLNENIKIYLEQLFKTIVDYIKQNASTISLGYNITSIINGNPSIYDINREYTYVLETIASLVKTIFDFDQDMLEQLAQRTIKGDNAAKAKLDAFNAWVILNNFDQYVDLLFGQAIEIKHFGKFRKENKYFLKGKTAKIASSWQNEDNIDMGAIADLITKKIVTTTPYYSFGNIESIPYKSLEYSHFQHIIGKLKSLSLNPIASKIIFDDNFINAEENKEFWESLTESTRSLLKGRSLAAIINVMLFSPRLYSSIVFDVIANPLFLLKNTNTLGLKYWNIQKNTLYNLFNTQERDILWSLHKGIFDYNSNSIRKLSNAFGSFDFYSYITLEVDRIWDVNSVQYYSVNNEVRAVSLQDYNIARIKQNLEATINQFNNKDFIDFETLSEKISDVQKDGDRIASITINLNNFKIVVSNKGQITIKLPNGDPATGDLILNLYNTSDFSFIENILRLDFKRDFLFYQEFVNNLGSEYNANRSLMTMAARTVFLIYASHKSIDYSRHLTILLQLDSLDLGYSPGLNPIGELNLLHRSDVQTLENLALCKAITNGQMSSTIVRNGLGNTQSAQVNSRLFASYPSQFELQNKKGKYYNRIRSLTRLLNDPLLDPVSRKRLTAELDQLPKSATADCILLNQEDLFRGIHIVSEYAGDRIVPTVDLNVLQLSNINILYDYIRGLYMDTRNEVVGNGTVAFYSSVNSDKNDIGKLAINLNVKVDLRLADKYSHLFKRDGVVKSYGELDAPAIYTIILEEFGKIYSNIYKGLEYEWLRLFKYINSLNEYSEITFNHLLLTNFTEFSTWFAMQKVTGKIDKKLTEVQFIKSIVAKFNKVNSLDPIKLVDLMHYVSNDGYLATNQSLLSNLVRFDNGSYFSSINRIYDVDGNVIGVASLDHLRRTYMSGKEFWSRKESELLESLIGCHFGISTNNSRSEEINKVAEKLRNTEWLDVNGDVILGKVFINGVERNITSQADLQYAKEKLGLLHDQVLPNVRLNPIIQTYNALDYLFTLEWMISTVGSFLGHPSKLKIKPDFKKVLFNLQLVALTLANPYVENDLTLTISPAETKTSGITLYKLFDQNPRTLKLKFNGSYSLVQTGALSDILLTRVATAIASLLKIGESVIIPLLLAKFFNLLGFFTSGINLGIVVLTKKQNISTSESIAEVAYTDEAKRYKAQDKRNVNYTATVNPFALGEINGVPRQYNMAVIEDIKETLGIVYGMNLTIKPFDGATFVNPFVVLLENMSLKGALAGITKKQFAHFYDETIATGGTLKTAGFGLTNDWIRNSKLLANLVMKMTRGEWKDLLGKSMAEAIDVTVDCFTRPIHLDDSTNGYEPIYFKRNGRYYNVQKITKIPNTDTYLLEIVEVDQKGTIISDTITETRTVRSNYDLWQMFGGAYSMEVNETTRLLQWSESSIKNVVTAINRVGVAVNSPNIKTVYADFKGKVYNIYLPLKYSDIHYLATEGAVKQGAANINSRNKYTNNEDFDYQVMNLYSIGILLDKEHHADESELSLLTLVISACAFKGYSFEDASRLYNALAAISQTGLSEYMDDNDKFLEREEFRELLIKNVVKAIEKGASYESLINNIAHDLTLKSKEEGFKYSEQNIPLSEQGVYRKFLSLVAVMFTNVSIKYKIPGTLAVLTPSHNIIRLYDGRKLEHFDDFDSEIFEILHGSKTVIDAKDIQIGQTYLLDINNDTDNITNDQMNPLQGSVSISEIIDDDGNVNWDKYLEIFNGYFDSAPMELFSKGTRENLSNRPEHHEGENFTIDHIKNVVKSVRDLSVPTHLKKPLILAALLHDVGKPFHNDNHGADAVDIINTLFADFQDANLIRLAVQYHMFGNEPTKWKDAAVYMIASAIDIDINIDDFIDLILALNTADILRGRDVYFLENDRTLLDVISEETKEKRKLLIQAKNSLLNRITIANEQELLDVIFALNSGKKIYKMNNPYIVDEKDGVNIETLEDFIEVVDLTSYDPAMYPDILFILEASTENVSSENRIPSSETINIYDQSTIQNILNAVTQVELGREYFIYSLDTETGEWGEKSELIQTPTDYYKLQNRIREGTVASIRENKLVGRELAGYNCRFAGKNGQRYLIWDLDSIKWLYEANEAKDDLQKLLDIAKRAFPYFNKSTITYKALETSLRKLVQRDLYNLSKNSLDILQLYKELKSSKRKTEEWYTRYINIVNILLDTRNGNKLKLNGIEYQVNDDTFAEVDALVQQEILKHKQVRINGELVEVDKNTILIQPYEIIMPKRFATVFGLDTFVNIQDIINDKDYFIKLLISHQSLTLDDSKYYTVALKRSNGKHFYVLDKSQAPSLLLMNRDIQTFEEDGVVYVQDSDGNKLFPLYLRLNDDGTYELDKVIVHGDTKIILTDNIEFYIDKLKYNSIEFSDNISDNTLERLVRYMEWNPSKAALDDTYSELHTRNKAANAMFKLLCLIEEIPIQLTDWERGVILFLTRLNITAREQVEELLNNTEKEEHKLYLLKILERYNRIKKKVDLLNRGVDFYKKRNLDLMSIRQRNKLVNSVTIDNYQSPEYKQIIKYFTRLGRLQHASFLKSLEIIAARIPAQCLLSVMLMKCVGFENQDINNAYVSIYLILLQGSDFDIDSVSLETFDISPDGTFLAISPYAVTNTKEGIDASMNLPFPTGERLVWSLVSEAITTRLKNLRNWKKFVNNYFSTILNVETEGTDLVITYNIETVEDLLLFSRLLQDVLELKIPLASEMDTLLDLFQELVPDILLERRHLKHILEQLINFVDRHNLYLEELDSPDLIRLSNNTVTLSIYTISGDPINLLLSQAPVDSITEPLKEKAALSREANKILRDTPGNFNNKNEARGSNMVGKDGIGINAVGLKSFGALSYYFDDILNNGTKEEQATLFSPTYNRLLANVRAVNPNTIKDPNVLAYLASTEIIDDQALINSALLSLSADNAKELVLSKLNADPRLMGMYIMGILLGYDFNEMADIIMSRTADKIVDLVLNYELEAGQPSVQSILKKFEFNYVKKIVGLLYTLHSIIPEFYALYQEIRANIPNTKEQATETIYAFATDKQMPFTLKIEILEKHLKRNTDALKILKDYICFMDGVDFNTVKKLRDLSIGAEETRILGAILGLNLGLKTSEVDYFEQLFNFESALENALLAQGNNDSTRPKMRVDVIAFVEDPEYRLKVIEQYETVKSSFNVYAVVTLTPHFFKYLLALAASVKAKDLSIKHRSKHALYTRERLYNPFSDRQKLISGIDRYLNNTIINNWLQSLILEIPITEGNEIFGRSGSSNKVGVISEITTLGTDWGNLNFKLFFERTIVPDLKKGLHVSELITLDNAFIKALTPVLNINTISHNPVLNYSLDINMSPLNDIEYSLLRQYQSAFLELANVYYQYPYVVLDSAGKLVTLYKSIPLTDLFIYYSMIANEWTLGQRSLRKIFEPLENKGTIQSYNDFVGLLDNSSLIIEDQGNLDLYIAPIATFRTARAKSVYILDKVTKLYTLYESVDGSYVSANVDQGLLGKVKEDEYQDLVSLRETTTISDLELNIQMDYTIAPNGDITLGKLIVRFLNGEYLIPSDTLISNLQENNSHLAEFIKNPDTGRINTDILVPLVKLFMKDKLGLNC